MKLIKIIVLFAVVCMALCSCIHLHYTSAEGQGETHLPPKSEIENIAPEETEPSESEAEVTENVEETEPVTEEITAEATEPETEPETEAETEPITEAPTVTDSPEAVDEPSGIYLIDLTSPIKPNKKASLEVRGKPRTEYTVKVIYATTESKADGLGSKVSDESGFVSWQWKIGASVKPGRYKITVTGGGEVFETTLQVE